MSACAILRHPLPNPPHKGEGARSVASEQRSAHRHRSHPPPCGEGWGGGLRRRAECRTHDRPGRRHHRLPRPRAASPIVAELTSVRGSTPREQGAFMLMGTRSIYRHHRGRGARIYGDRAGAAGCSRDGAGRGGMDVPLGPEIGQCCGGRVEVSLQAADAALRRGAGCAACEARTAARPHVYVFGAGHVGQALARALALLPLKVHVIDTRPRRTAGLPAMSRRRRCRCPRRWCASAPAGQRLSSS